MILVRHGESEGNSSGVIQGRIDTPLSGLGVRQARQAGEALRGLSIDAIIASPLLRAQRTAEVIGDVLRLPVSLDVDLMEYDHGEISGLTGEQIAARFPEVRPTSWGVGLAFDGSWIEIPGAEGRAAFFDRVSRAIERIQAMTGTVAVITHGGFVNAACHAVLGMDYLDAPHMFRTANCSFTEITLDRQGRWILLRQNDACHLNVKTTPLEA